MRRGRGAWALALALGVAITGPVQAAGPVAEPEGYHGAPYLSAVPATLTGAGVVGDIAALDALIARGAVLIDVLPQVRRPEGLPAGTLWRQPVHRTLPGAVWLPGSGYDRLNPDAEAGFAKALAALGSGKPPPALVFFCKADCWMSWNAAKRALALGHGAVHWFPGGTDDWTAAGRALEPVEPWAP